MKRAGILAALAMCLSGCVSMQPDLAATLRLECDVPEAAVLLDDVMMGRVSELNKVEQHIRPGFYRVELRHPDYYTYYTEFQVEDDGVAVVKATLHRRLD
jgi:hypothetical protein